MLPPPAPFRPALIVVDFQNDFCPPTGSLAVPGGRALAPTINALLALPFTLRIATRDSHPQSHISFASNHPAPHNVPFDSHATIANPRNPAETLRTRLWPDHCVQGTHGAALVDELRADALDRVVDKGTDDRVEMYSAFAAPFRAPVYAESGVEAALRGAGVTHVFAVGLAYDYCVKHTALDAAERGFETFVVEDAVKPVSDDPVALRELRAEFEKGKVRIVTSDGPEVGWVRQLA